MTDRSQFDHETTTDQVLEGIDLQGKVAIVTGSSGGLGAEAAWGPVRWTQTTRSASGRCPRSSWPNTSMRGTAPTRALR